MKPPQAQLEIVYQKCWNDGFGARGWKIAPSIDDPRVIASSTYVGLASPTCVLIHDIMDHHLCGLSIGGHRNEMVATLLHAMRNGLPVRKSIDMMIDEFLTSGYCGEEISEFLADDLLEFISPDTPSERVPLLLSNTLGEAAIRSRLLDHYYNLGLAGLAPALMHYENLGLSLSRRYELGVRLQLLLEEAEACVIQDDTSCATGILDIADEDCSLILSGADWRIIFSKAARDLTLL